MRLPPPVPKYLRDPRTGAPRSPPASVAELLRCSICGATLVRAETGWVCGLSLHGGLWPDQVLIERMQALLPGPGDRRRSAKRVLFIQRRVLAWLRKVDDERTT